MSSYSPAIILLSVVISFDFESSFEGSCSLMIENLVNLLNTYYRWYEKFVSFRESFVFSNFSIASWNCTVISSLILALSTLKSWLSYSNCILFYTKVLTVCSKEILISRSLALSYSSWEDSYVNNGISDVILLKF